MSERNLRHILASYNVTSLNSQQFNTLRAELNTANNEGEIGTALGNAGITTIPAGLVARIAYDLETNRLATERFDGIVSRLRGMMGDLTEIKGSFSGLNWRSWANLLVALLLVAMVGYGLYKSPTDEQFNGLSTDSREAVMALRRLEPTVRQINLTTLHTDGIVGTSLTTTQWVQDAKGNYLCAPDTTKPANKDGSYPCLTDKDGIVYQSQVVAVPSLADVARTSNLSTLALKEQGDAKASYAELLKAAAANSRAAAGTSARILTEVAPRPKKGQVADHVVMRSDLRPGGEFSGRPGPQSELEQELVPVQH